MIAELRREWPTARQPRFAAAFLSIAVSGCSLQAAYQRPLDSVPQSYRFDDQAIAATAPPSDWWALFADPTLNALVVDMLRNNQDLVAAYAHYAEARAMLGSARADQYPALIADPEVTRGRYSQTVDDAFPQANTTNVLLALDMAYEIDLWGKVRNSIDVAKSQRASAALAVAVTRLSLAADLTTAYFQVRAYDEEIRVLVRTDALRQEALALMESRLRIGSVGELDVTRARADLASTQADTVDVRRRRESMTHVIALLTGKLAPEFTLVEENAPAVIPAIPAGLPSELLERRPDVAQAERQLAGAYASIGVSRAARFPSLKLTGSGGEASNSLATLFNAGSPAWFVGAAMSAPLIDAGRNASNVRAAQARYEAALARYRQQTLAAFREVQDSLSDQALHRERLQRLHEATVASEGAARLSRARYERGLVGYFEVVDSERIALSNERAEVQAEQSERVATISLIKALGGGWTPGPV